MDWIDEKLDGIKKRLLATSLRQSLVVYSIVAIVIVMIAYVCTMQICKSWEQQVRIKYTGIKYTGINYTGITGNSLNSLETDMSIDKIDGGMDKILIRVLILVKQYSIVLYSIMAIIVVVNMFYRSRLQVPIALLLEEANYIKRNDLSFDCQYNSRDEMGAVCHSFDSMRIQLLKNQQVIWGMMEDQRKLNAVFAHDIRTPLTVMKGYVELLIKFYPVGKISEEKLLTTLELMKGQVERIYTFSESMKEIQTFESMQIKQKDLEINSLIAKLKDMVVGLEQVSNLSFTVQTTGIQGCFYYDEQVVLEVIENMISNAISYAKSNVDIVISVEADYLNVYIRDDGKGFAKEDLYKALEPYYTARESDNHNGLGLSICKLLCEKHGGGISLANSTKGGAVVSASFYIK